MDKWYLINDKALHLIFRTSRFRHCFWLFHSQGCLLLNSQSKPHCTFELPILMGRPCQEEFWIHTDLRSDVRYHILCLTAFEAQTLPKYNTHIIPTLTKLSCDEQLHWDRNYSTNVPAPGSPKISSTNRTLWRPLCSGERYGHSKGRNQSSSDYPRYYCLGTGPVTSKPIGEPWSGFITVILNQGAFYFCSLQTVSTWKHHLTRLGFCVSYILMWNEIAIMKKTESTHKISIPRFLFLQFVQYVKNNAWLNGDKQILPLKSHLRIFNVRISYTLGCSPQFAWNSH